MPMLGLVQTTPATEVTISDALGRTRHLDAHPPIGEPGTIRDALRSVCTFYEVETLGQLVKLRASQMLSVLADCPYALAVVKLANALLGEHKLPRMDP